ncbi:MAG: F-type H+-transporting ATPase subunit delta [Rhodospirillaceae bacterium]|nr:MAG: F-type H+-transporting ATPase subunit delta [Rhodospirillaceae bacterium]
MCAGNRELASEKAGVAGRYATALFELADEGKLLEQVESDLTRLRAVLAISADFQHFVASPVLSREEQITSMAAVSEAVGLSALTQRFLEAKAGPKWWQHSRCPAISRQPW